MASEPPVDSTERWGEIVGFSTVLVELADGNDIEVPIENFRTRDISAIKVGSIVKLLQDDKVEIPEAEYATPEQLAVEEMEAEAWLSRAASRPQE